ncbi:P-type ATPase, subfamily V, partial [Kipferlia bialata]
DWYIEQNMPLPTYEGTWFNIVTKHPAFHPLHVSCFLYLVPLLVHSLVSLAIFWVLDIKARLVNGKTKPEKAWSVLVKPTPGMGKPALCRVRHTMRWNGPNCSGPQWTVETAFSYNARKYVLNAEAGTFLPLSYPMDLAMPQYYNSLLKESHHGMTASVADRRLAHYGDNALAIAVPSFKETLIEHIMAPFFVFQVFCCLLWMFDDFALFSIFTLGILVLMEGVTVVQRINSVICTMYIYEIQKLAPRTSLVHILRNGKWAEHHSSDILPGDIVSFNAVPEPSQVSVVEEVVPPTMGPGQRPNPFAQLSKLIKPKKLGAPPPPQYSPICPADMVLLAGAAVADEAILTGEAAPQIKEPLSAVEGCDPETLITYMRTGALPSDAPALDSPSQRLHCVFAGTRLVSSSPPPPVSNDYVSVPLPSGARGKGPIFMALRTGFATEQGRLVRSIAFDKERLSANNKEALVYMFVLLQFAFVFAFYTFKRGIESIV